MSHTALHKLEQALAKRGSRTDEIKPTVPTISRGDPRGPNVFATPTPPRDSTATAPTDALGGYLESIKPQRMAEVFGKPIGEVPTREELQELQERQEPIPRLLGPQEGTNLGGFGRAVDRFGGGFMEQFAMGAENLLSDLGIDFEFPARTRQVDEIIARMGFDPETERRQAARFGSGNLRLPAETDENAQQRALILQTLNSRDVLNRANELARSPTSAAEAFGGIAGSIPTLGQGLPPEQRRQATEDIMMLGPLGPMLGPAGAALTKLGAGGVGAKGAFKLATGKGRFPVASLDDIATGFATRPGVARGLGEAPITPATARAGVTPATALPGAAEEVSQFVRPAVSPSHQTTQQALVQALRKDPGSVTTPDLYEAFEVGLKAAADEAHLPRPPRPPALASKSGATPNDPAGAFAEVLNARPGQKPVITLLARWEGARKAAAKELSFWWKDGQKKLRVLGMGMRVRDKQVLSEADSRSLFMALHNRQISPPSHLKEIYDDLLEMVAREESDMLAFDPDFAKTMMAHPDYFPRGWKDTRYGGKGQIGARPSFLKPRNDASFTDMLDAGFEPVSWNPYDMMTLRRIQGIEYRETMQMMNALKKAGLVVSEKAAPEGWVVPDIGPAFTGRPFTGIDGVVRTSGRLATTAKLAKRLEAMWGVQPKFVVEGKNILPAITKVSAAAKRQVLLFSGFQHMDFATRGGGVAFTLTGIRSGAPLKYPSLVGRLIQATLDPRRRRMLGEKQVSDAPMFDDFDITLRMIADEGWQIGGDPSVLRRDALSGLQDILVAGRPGLPRRAVDRINGAIKFWESGLFEGAYPEVQIFALEKYIVPKLRRMHKEWNSQQIAAASAEEVNKMFSALGEWQTIFSGSPELQTFSRALIFSTNESEAWLSAAFSTVKGPNKRLWGEYWVGYATFLAAVANGLNMATTGKPLSADQYLPISFNDPYAMFSDEVPIIGGIGYNTGFISPVLPWAGRNGSRLYLDIVGQADTPLRWIINAPEAFRGRVNVIPNMVTNQVQAKTFYDEPISGPKERAIQAARDVVVPMGLGNLLQAGREAFPTLQEHIPEEEGRLGGSGLGFQGASGFNIRAEGTKRFLDRHAEQSGMINFATGQPVREWDDLEFAQQNQLIETTPDLKAELDLRHETSVRRKRGGAEAREWLKKANDVRIKEEEALVRDLTAGIFNIDKFRDLYSDAQMRAAVRRSTLDESFQIFVEDGEMPEKATERALVNYYKAFSDARHESGFFNFEKLEVSLAELDEKWTQAQRDYVDRNTGLTEHPPLIEEYLRDRDRPDVKAWRLATYKFMADQGVLSLYRQYQRSEDKASFRASEPGLARLIRRSQNSRDYTREHDFELERILYKWGYIDTPKNSALKYDVGQLRKEQGGRITNRLAIDPESAGAAR
jgi:hypothetical protein